MITITTYKALAEYVNAFKEKKMNLLVIVSRGGLSKTWIVEDSLITEAPLIFSGHATPLSIYREVYDRTEEDPKCFVVFDDVDTLVMNKVNVSLLKQLSDTKQEKMVRYSSTSHLLDEYPKEFETSCKVIMLTNSLKFNDKNIDALMTRGHLVSFEPSNEEILNYLETWATEKDIMEFMRTFSYFAMNMNLRTYKMAEELKSSGIDWKKFVVEELRIEPRLLLVKELQGRYDNDIARIEEYMKVSKHSRADYYRFKKLYLSRCKVSQ